MKKDRNQLAHQLMEQYVLPTYKRTPLAFVKGRGAWVWDANGKKYLDFIAGIAVNNLGHAHPKVVQAIKEQATQLIHCSNLYCIPEQARLAKKLVRLTGLQKVFFCNSGAEAMEACIKLARYFSLKKYSDVSRTEILVFENSFHGRTLGALSATAQKKYQEGFGPLVPGFKIVPFNDFAALKSAISPQTCAILLEVVQCEGGVRFLSNGFLKQVRHLCDEQGSLLILDEVQTGVGRTGYFLASEEEKVSPDLLALAKALGSGIPIGACLANEKVASFVVPGIHASTFGGNALASQAAFATVSEISKKSFLAQVKKKGHFFFEELKQLASRYPFIKNVRGKGLLLACELSNEKAPQVVEACAQRGLLINLVQSQTLRFVPPLTVTKKEIQQAVQIVDEVMAIL